MKNLNFRQRLLVVAIATLHLACTGYFYFVVASEPRVPGALEPNGLTIFIIAFFRAVPISAGVSIGLMALFVVGRGIVRWVMAGKENSN